MAGSAEAATKPWAKGTSVGVIAICCMASLMEGLDIQSMGVAAPKMAMEYGLDPSQVGLAASASTLGLMIGAAIGGWLSDRIGRRLVLIASMIALGVFSLTTTISWSFASLLVMRLLAGLGLGGAFPNLIALTAESAAPKVRALAISIMYCGLPVGGAIASLVAANLGPMSWREIFYLGGVGPLLVAPVMVFLLRESDVFHRQKAERDADPAQGTRPSLGAVMTGEGRGASTALLWVSLFFTLVVVYILLNWLPTLIGGKGFSRPQGSLASLALNIGAALGSVTLGLLVDRGKTRPALFFVYGGLILALAGLAVLQGFGLVLVAAFAAGFFGIGGQLVLYAMAPVYYPTAIRGTGVGVAIAVGRIGSIAGPIVAGFLLATGAGATAVMAAAIPGLVLACLTAFVLDGRPKAMV